MKRLAFAAAVLLATAYALLPAEAPPRQTPRSARLGSPAPRAVAPIPALFTDDVPAEAEARHTRWAVSYAVRSTLGPNEGPAGRLTGEWLVEGQGDGRLKVELARVRSEGHHLMPAADVLDAPVELVAGPDGALAAMGFAPEAPATARRLFTALATQFWMTPGDGEWRVEEEDGTGRYVARYAQERADLVTRTVERYLAVHGPAGLVEAGAERITVEGATRFRFDAEGLAEVVGDHATTWVMGDDSLPVTARTQVRFLRIGRRVVTRSAPRFDAGPLGAHVDQQAIRDQRAVSLVGDADAAALIAEVARVAALDPAHPDTGKWRAATLERLSALVQIDPAAAEALSGAIRSNGADMGRNGLLIGALGSADTEAATAALATLIDADLPSPVQRNAIDHLALSEAPSAATIRALQEAIGGEHGDAATTALGAQARQLDATQPEAAEDIVDQLIERYLAAETVEDQRVIVQALGNTGSRKAAELLMINTRHHDAALADAATWALRFIPGEDVDAVLSSVLTAPTTQLMAGIRTIGMRDPGQWRAPLEDARARYADSARISEAIDAVLGRWGVGG